MSPRKDPLDPVKENIGKGTGIGTLTPTCKHNDQMSDKAGIHKAYDCPT